MGKLKALGSHIPTLKPTVGFFRQEPKGEAATREAYSPWRKWYKTARWRSLRLKIFARDLFTCQRPGCGRVEGNTSLLVADHREPHRGNERMFWDEHNLWTLCKPCHDQWKQKVEQGR